ncbi:MAG: polymer-forming cytoskeletal protein [Acidobacteria bacterium]|nr:MAG: polymer-forming cytoskeletal protein [Acidobacteriota bacterium]
MNSIGASVFIKGNITAAEELAITGRVEGDIRLEAGDLILAQGSQVVGDIAAPSVAVYGNVRGNVTATQRVVVRPGGSVSGSVTTPSLVVEDGAVMNCRVEMPAPARPRLAQAVVSVPPKLSVAV